LPSYLLATIVFTWPLLQSFAGAIPSSRVGSDPGIQAFILGWDWHALTAHPFRLFDPPIFYPERNALTYMDHLLGETLTAAPVLALGGSVPAAYNFLFLVSFAASAWAVYRLVRLLGVSRAGACLGGFLFAFSPYRYANLDVLNQLQTQFLPLGLWFALKFLRKYRARDLAGAAACLVAQVYFGWYYAYHLALALTLLVLVTLLGRSLEPGRVMRGRSAVVAAMSVLLIVPVTLPYAREHAVLTEFRRSLGECALYSADVLDYLKLNRNAVLTSWVPFAAGAQSYWPGLATVLLGALGAGGIRWRSGGPAVAAGAYFLALSATSFLVSLGPILQVAGTRIWIPLPYAALYYIVPGFSGMRAPARFAVLVLLGLAVLAGLGYERLRQRIRGRLPWRAVSLSLFAGSVVFAWPGPLSTIDLDAPTRMPRVYAWLARQPRSEPILELPVPTREAEESETDSIRQFWLLYHGHPRLDGTSGFVSRRYRSFRAAIQSFPSEGALQAAGGTGARLIVVHFADYAPARREALRAKIRGERRLVPLVEFGTDAVFRLAG